MADRITLDFENNTITWDTDTQKGVEYNPDLIRKKEQILEAMGYKLVDMTPAVRIYEDLLNGKISKEEADRRLAKVMHPDAGGNAESFRTLEENYQKCLEELKTEGKGKG